MIFLIFLNIFTNLKMKQSLRYKLLLLVLGFSPILVLAQQDPRLSMYMFDKMAINPAAAGSKDAMEAGLISRAQWLDIAGSPITNEFMFQAPFSSKKVGWGVEVMNDQIGPTSSTSIQGNYAYHLRLFSGQLSMGIGVGLYDYVIDFSKIDYKDKSDYYNTMTRSQQLVPTAEAGLYYYSQSFYLGVSVNHLIESRLTNESAADAATFKPHAYVIMGQGFTLSENVLFSPSIAVDLVQNAPPSGDINIAFLLQQKLWLGVSYRYNYGLIFLAAYRASKSLQIGYSYDLGLNAIGVAGGGAHELSVIVDFGGRNKTVQASPRYL